MTLPMLDRIAELERRLSLVEAFLDGELRERQGLCSTTFASFGGLGWQSSKPRPPRESQASAGQIIVIVQILESKTDVIMSNERLTTIEAAAALRKSERWLREWLKAHPQDEVGRSFFAVAGRTKLFTPADIDRIHEAMRCPSSSKARAPAKRHITRSAGHTSASMWTRASELTNDPSLCGSLLDRRKNRAARISRTCASSRPPHIPQCRCRIHEAGGSRRYVSHLIKHFRPDAA